MTELDDDADNDTLNTIADVVYTSGQSILSARRFSEFTPQLRFQSQMHSASSKKKLSCLVMKKLGDFNRFGIQPLALAHEENVSLESAEMTEVAFYTVKGGHFDGELLVTVEKWKKEEESSVNDDEIKSNKKKKKKRKKKVEKNSVDADKGEEEKAKSNDVNVVVSVSLYIPKKGRKLPKKIAERIVTSLSSSIASSIMTESKKTISRKIQLGSIQRKTSVHAKQRRHERAENEKKIEEMAKDRKRRWQRGSPSDGGRYRPSGNRMRSPKNC